MKKQEHKLRLSTLVVPFTILAVVIVSITSLAIHQHQKPISVKDSAAMLLSQAATQSKSKTATQSSPPIVQPAQTITSPTSVVTVQTTPSSVSFLDIKEWGVKIPLPSTVKDAYYTTKGSNVGADGLPNTVWVGLTSLNSSGCNVSSTGPSSTARPVGSIIRVAQTDRDPVHNTLYTQLYPGGVTIGSYYYVFIPWNSSCASSSTLQSIHNAFAATAKSTVSDVAN